MSIQVRLMMAETIGELTAGSGAGGSAPLVTRLRAMEQVRKKGGGGHSCCDPLLMPPSPPPPLTRPCLLLPLTPQVMLKVGDAIRLAPPILPPEEEEEEEEDGSEDLAYEEEEDGDGAVYA